MADTEKYNIHIVASNIGPHENLNQPCDAGEDGPIRIGVFASNGGGKSSLSRQFRLLSFKEADLPISNKYLTLGKDQGKFKFKFFRQDDPTEKHEFEIAHSCDKSPRISNKSQLLFRVFNSDYVRESIEPNNYGQDKDVDGYIIGKDVVDLTKENAELESLRKKYGELKDKIDEEIKDCKKELQQAGIRANTNEFTSITFDNIVGNSYNPPESEPFKSIKVSLKKLEGIPDDLNDVTSHNSNFGSDLSFLNNLADDLNAEIEISTLSEEFKAKISIKEDFIRKGVELLAENDSECPFCEQKLNTSQLSLIDDFVAYLKDAETVYKNSLKTYNSAILELKEAFNRKYKEFLKVESEYNATRDYFPSYKDEKIDLPQDPSTTFNWDFIVSCIKTKITNTAHKFKPEDTKEFKDFILNIKSYFKSIDANIESNNLKVKAINATKLNTNSEALSLKKRMCNALFLELKAKLKVDINSLRASIKEEKEKAEQIKIIESKAKKLKKDIVVDTFNDLMRFIFSDKYEFDKDNNYLKFKNHSLKTNAHDILSDGEKNVIAFCYYVAETHAIIEYESDYDKLFFIIDDPISSMDFHYTYSLCRILERLDDCFSFSHKKKLRFILFTHNLEFMSILLRNNVIQKKYVLTPGKLKELKKELVMPYHEHLSDIYKVAHGTQEPCHTTPNSMRNVLETIGRFENPDQSLILFVDRNEELKKCSSLYNMIQDLSHGVIRSQPAILPDDIKTGCATIVKFLENRYKGQIDNVKRTV